MKRARGAVSAVLVLLLAGALAGCTGPAPVAAGPPDGSGPSSSAQAPETGRPGTPDWDLHDPGPDAAIEGFADRTSVLPGQPFRLFVSTTASSFSVVALRFGAYTGSDVRTVWTSPPQQGHAQPPAEVRGPTHTVVASWQPSLTVSTDGWPPGDYLLRLDASDGVGQRFVPITVRTPDNRGRVVVVNAVTTWQAYNQWGGYSLYKGPDGQRATRSRAVSFDRPYEAGMQGAGQFFQFELGAVRVAERSGVALGYATDVDLHADPHLLDGAAAMVTLGHDEYWTADMRAHATTARDAGTNLAFLGGNEVYRHMRFADTDLGPNRLEINYKSFAEDPEHIGDPSEATQDWRQPPDPRPESVLVGTTYSCFPGRADLVVADPDSWLLTGLVTAGQRFKGVVGIEYAHVDLAAPTPRPIQVLFHSPVVCGTTKRADFADATYYTVGSGAGVFTTGTQDWVCGMDPACTGPAGNPDTARVLAAVTTRLLTRFAAGPAGRDQPARDNLDALHIRASRTAASPDSD